MKALGVFLAAVAMMIVGALFNGWILMLTIGATHDELGWPDNTISYWAAVGLALLLSFVVGIFRGTRS